MPSTSAFVIRNAKNYSICSIGLLIYVIINSYCNNKQFYLILKDLSESPLPLCILGNSLLVVFFLVGYGIKTFFLGNLRDIEIEYLNEKIFPGLIELLLSFTFIQTAFSMQFIGMNIILVFIKIFYYIIQKRVDFAGQISMDMTSYWRLMCVNFLFTVVDGILVLACIKKEMNFDRSNIFLIFKFEFMILFFALVVLTLKYTISLMDILNLKIQFHKNIIIIFLQLVGDFLQLVTTIYFFYQVSINFSLPLHLMRQIVNLSYLFRRRFKDLVRYLRAISNMNNNFPNATEQQLEQSHRICIICREDMNEGKKLPCGHVLHFNCLREWLLHQRICPTCRVPLLNNQNSNSSINNSNDNNNNNGNNGNNNINTNSSAHYKNSNSYINRNNSESNYKHSNSNENNNLHGDGNIDGGGGGGGGGSGDGMVSLSSLMGSMSFMEGDRFLSHNYVWNAGNDSGDGIFCKRLRQREMNPEDGFGVGDKSMGEDGNPLMNMSDDEIKSLFNSQLTNINQKIFQIDENLYQIRNELAQIKNDIRNRTSSANGKQNAID